MFKGVSLKACNLSLVMTACRDGPGNIQSLRVRNAGVDLVRDPGVGPLPDNNITQTTGLLQVQRGYS